MFFFKFLSIHLTEVVSPLLPTSPPPSLSPANEDFLPSEANLTLPAHENSSISCASFTVLSDQLALEGDEVFGVSFQLLGVDANGRILFADGAYAVTLGQLTEATVTIEDNNSKQLWL